VVLIDKNPNIDPNTISVIQETKSIVYLGNDGGSLVGEDVGASVYNALAISIPSSLLVGDPVVGTGVGAKYMAS